MWVKVQKYALIGCLNVGLDFIVYTFCIAFFDMKPMIAHIFAWSVAVQFSYLMNSFFTFKQALPQVFMLKPWLKFIISNLFALFCSSLTLYLALPLLGIYGAKMIAIMVSYMVGFLLSQLFVFREKNEK